MEDEAVLDRGASLLKHVCDEEEAEGKFTSVYVCVCETRRKKMEVFIYLRRDVFSEASLSGSNYLKL